MRMNIWILTATLLLLLPVSVSTAQSGPDYIDYAEAQSRLSDLGRETDTRQSEVDAMEQENKTLQESIREWRSELEQINELIRKTRNRKTDLYLSRRAIVDSDMKSETQSLLEESETLVNGLERAKLQREESIEKALATIDRNEAKITTNRAVILRNKEQIAVLEESVDKTQGQTEFIQDVKTDLQAYRKEASKFL